MSDKDKNDRRGAGIEPELLRELAGILRDTGLSEIEVEQGDLRLKLVRFSAPPAAAPMVTAASAPMATIAAMAPAPAAQAPAPDPAADARSHPGAVPSPMVGTAYLSPEPGAAMFVKEGDQVRQGQTLLIVEAMKTFNPIPAPRAGRVVRLLVSDGEPVEFAQPLVILE